MSRLLLVGTGVMALALAGCSKAPDRSADRSGAASDNAAVSDDMALPGVITPPAMRAPGIDVTAAPGVAFNYRYGFRLPAERIAGVQEAHAQACEKLGVARCRITGMSFHLAGENDVEGELDFKLDPTLARGFGRQGIAAVEGAKGTLIDAAISGTDAGATIDRAAVDRARATDAAKQLDAALAKARSAAERTQLQAQRADAARQIAAAGDTAADARASLATTPVTFRYESGPAVRGFDTSAPLTSALDTAVASAQTTLAVVLAILAIFGPPALVALLLFLGIRRWRATRRGTPGDTAG